MNIVVVVRQVPDLIETLDIDPTGTALDWDNVSFIVNECDDHALEQALLLKLVQGRVETAFAKVEVPVCPGVDRLADLVAVHGAAGDDFEQHGVERSADQVRISRHGTISFVAMNPGCLWSPPCPRV